MVARVVLDKRLKMLCLSEFHLSKAFARCLERELLHVQDDYDLEAKAGKS